MTVYVLDAVSISRFPDVLELNSYPNCILIPKAVANELLSRSNAKERYATLSKAVNSSGFVEAEVRNLTALDIAAFYLTELTPWEYSVIDCAEARAKAGDHVIVVTDDFQLQSEARKHNLAVLTVPGLRAASYRWKKGNNNFVQKYISQKIRGGYELLFVVFVGGAVFGSAAVYASFIVCAIGEFVRDHATWLLVIPLILASWVAHSFRAWSKFYYGIVEFIVGVLSCYFSTTQPSAEFAKANALSVFLACAASLFVVVRALGNVHDGLITVEEYSLAYKLLKSLLNPTAAFRNRKSK